MFPCCLSSLMLDFVAFSKRRAGLVIVFTTCLSCFFLSACGQDGKPDEQYELDKQFISIGNEAVLGSSEKIAEAERAYVKSVQETVDRYTGKTLKKWVCKTLDVPKQPFLLGKDAPPISFDCFNLDGRRGSLFNLIAPAALLGEPIAIGDVFRFSGTVDKVMFVPDMKAVVLFKVSVTTLERIEHIKH
jgi:hypothetical protein